MLGFPLLYFKGMRLTMFQLSSFYCMWTLWVRTSSPHPKARRLAPEFRKAF